MKLKYLSIFLLALPLLYACEQKVEDVPESSPTIEFNSKNVNVPAYASDVTATLTANCDWTASSSASWLKISPTSGTRATTAITISIEENTVEETPRSGEITITGGGVSSIMTVSQGAPAGPVAPGTQIYTPEDFLEFLSLAPTFTAEDETKVFNDIDLGGATIFPVTIYSGVFDGQDHRIYNFKVVSSSETSGLILENYGTVKNVVFGSSDGSKYDGVSTISASENAGGSSTGLVAVNYGTLDKVSSFVTVNFVAQSTAAAKFGVGGITGTASASETSSSVISNCVNYATINASGTLKQDTSFGGVIGYVSSEGVQVTSCTNNANLTIGIPVTKVVMIGGVVGRTDKGGTFDKLTNNGAVEYVQESKPSTWMSIGGVMGTIYNSGKLTGAVNNGSVSSNHLQVNRIGGILGVMNSGGEVSGATNKGSVTLSQDAANGNWQAVGGIVGFQEKSTSKDKDNVIKDNTNLGAVTVNVENNTSHANAIGAGGILGEGCLELSVTGNTNAGDVTITNKAAGAVHAGGIYGSILKNSGGFLSENNSNSGTIKAETSDNAKGTAGGVAGYIAAATGSDANKMTITLSSETNTGAIVCANTSGVGSIAGVNGNGILSNCQVGGTVNGTAVTTANVGTLIQGSSSAGSYANPSVVGGAVVEGDGIKNADDFKAFMTATDFSAWTSDGVINVLADIDLGGATIAPMTAFAGVLDGQGHKIYNFKVVGTGNQTALFLTNSGTIRNLVLGSSNGLTYDGTSVVTMSEGAKATATSGAVVATNNGTISNVTNFLPLTIDFSGNTANAGYGCMVGTSAASSVVESCTNYGSLNLSGSAGKEVYIGGIIGAMTQASATAKDCVNSADLQWDFNMNTVACLGGVVGRSVGVIEGCINKGKVRYTQPSSPKSYIHLGGVVGALYSGAALTGCENDGEVFSNIQQVNRAGGICGTLNGGCTITSSVNKGSVTVSQASSNSNWQAVGGICGFEEKGSGNKISGCTNEGAVRLECENATTHNNKVSTGGIIGTCALALEISDNINSGSVTIVNKTSGNSYGGGIVGYIRAGADISTSGNRNTGNVSVTDPGNSVAGGIVGNSEKNTTTHTGDRSVCSVTGTTAGAAAGINAATITSPVLGGSVNGTTLTASNVESLAVGSGSGKISGVTLAQ